MFDPVTLKLNVDPLIMSALRDDISGEDVSTNSRMLRQAKPTLSAKKTVSSVDCKFLNVFFCCSIMPQRLNSL